MRNRLLLVSLFGILFFAIGGCGKTKVYTIVFDANGGSGEMKAQTFADGVEQALIANTFSRDNYNFAGWNTMADGTGLAYLDRQEVTLTENLFLYAQWDDALSINGHAYVDLELPSGNLWATCNVGATNPEDFGNYYAWGETVAKDSYTWGTYIYAECSSHNDPRLTKYCDNPYYGNDGFVDNLTTLETIDDAATINWGSGWRTPGIGEFNELSIHCTYIWTKSNGINGLRFTGPNGKSIFIPAAGGCGSNGFYKQDSACNYWCSDYSSSPLTPYSIYSDSSTNYSSRANRLRYGGLSIRPVCSRK